MDGIVIKVNEQYREKLGENSHDPNWAKAIKFKPVGAVTEVIDIEWNMGKTGAYAPVLIFKPTNLDGTVVKRASGYNYSHLNEHKLFPGATVRIAKAGDIIPQVIEVLTTGKSAKFNAPAFCKHCGQPLSVDGKQLMCINDNCSGLAEIKFHHAVGVFDLKHVGGSFLSQLYAAGFTSAFDILDKSKTNKDSLMAAGIANGKILANFIKERDGVTKLSYQNVIRMQGFQGMGLTASLQVAKKLSGQSYSFDGLEKTVVDGFDTGESKYKKVEFFLKYVSNLGIELMKPEDISKAIKVEFTGSPKPLFNSKKEFLAAIKSKGIAHTKITEANYLITDKLDGTSSKMKKAESMRADGSSIKTVTYEQFFTEILK
jgi:DNA ligase (NAD+)